MAKSRKLTYRELLDQVNKRDTQIVAELQKLSIWISTVERMLNWFIKWYLSKRNYKKFMEYASEEQKKLNKEK